MNLPLTPPIEPMDAQPADEIPTGGNWQYEPKWDGFRCVAFRDGDEIYLQSRSGKPLGRYFPDMTAALSRLKAQSFVLDGELVIPFERRLSFEQLQLRLHPAASRVRKLAEEAPAVFLVFDVLATSPRKALDQKPLAERREQLEAFAARYFRADAALRLSPATHDVRRARRWYAETSGALDGIIAKRLDRTYEQGSRQAAVKVKRIRSADCVVGGFRYATKGSRVGSLLLGLYDDEGRLDHVGYTSSLGDNAFEELTPQLERLQRRRGTKGFTGRAPGGPSRWSTERSGEYVALPHHLVVEVAYDHVSGERFRHGTTFLRWRSDKEPRQCLLSQIAGQETPTTLLPAAGA